MSQTSGLGRGLNSLIPNKKARISADPTYADNTDDGVEEIFNVKEKIIEIPTNKISPNPHQPRTSFESTDLEELTNSISEHGIIQPLIVTKDGDGWQLIAGERRLRSAKSLNLKTVPVIVRRLDDQKKLEVALIENLQRTDLDALETAYAYQKLIDEFNLSQEQLAKKVGKSRSAVANTIRVLNTIPKVREAIKDKKISEGHARVLAGLLESDQEQILDRIMIDNLNVREAEKAGKEVVVKKHIRKVSFDPDLRAKEDKLQKVLGTKVEIKKFGNSGQIIIKFFSDEELNDILNKIR